MEQSFAGHDYLRLVTFRKNGQGVPTAMWFVLAEDGKMYLQTNGTSAKVKRMRNIPGVEVAPSDSRGGPLGPLWSGTARIFEENSDEARRADQMLAQRYGWKRKLVNSIIWLARKGGQQIYFVIEDLRLLESN